MAVASGLRRQFTLGEKDVHSALASETSNATASTLGALSVNPAHCYTILAAGVTDPGVQGRQNQDEFFLWSSPDGQTVVAGVLDGHGRELGQLAARVARATFLAELSKGSTLQRLRVSPKATLEGLFAQVHAAIEEAFFQHSTGQGWTVQRSPEGYLLRAKGSGGQPGCVHGGTTATIVVVLDGRRVLVSNVGDSTAIMAGLGAAGTLRPVEEWVRMTTGPGTGTGGAMSVDAARAGAGAGAGSSSIAATTTTGARGRAGSCETGGARGATASAAGAIATQSGEATSSSSTTAPSGSSAAASQQAQTGSGVSAVLCATNAAELAELCAVAPPPADLAASYMELSADHSPESVTEFHRMARFRPRGGRANGGHGSGGAGTHHYVQQQQQGQLPIPELLFVYDTLTPSKLACPPIFEVNHATGACVKTDRGSYYKNVRSEWATLVATPPSAAFQDALAFTRSLGDLHLQSYGVSHVPETWWMDITNPGASAAASGANGGAGGAGSPKEEGGQSPGEFGGNGDAAAAAAAAAGPQAPLLPTPLAIILASDGIWDNWRYDEVAAFTLDASRVRRVARAGRADAGVAELMSENLARGHANFGTSADNMTVVVMWCFPRIT